MDLTIEQYERIQKFADGKMTAEEHELFLAELSSHAELMECLDLELFIRSKSDLGNATLEGQDPLSNSVYMKSLISEIGNEWHKKKPDQQPTTETPSLKNIGGHAKKTTPVFSLWRSIAVAATVLLAVSVLFWLLTRNKSPEIADKVKDSPSTKQDTLINKQNSDTVKSIIYPKADIDYASLYRRAYRKDLVPENVPELLADAFIDYNDGDYKTLQRFNLDNLPRSRGQQDQDEKQLQLVRELGHYYKGISYIETRNEEKAAKDFEWIVNHSKDILLRGKAQWYLALLNLKKGNKSDAVALLVKVADYKTLKPYNVEAQKLLKLLR